MTGSPPAGVDLQQGEAATLPLGYPPRQQGAFRGGGWPVAFSDQRAMKRTVVSWQARTQRTESVQFRPVPAGYYHAGGGPIGDHEQIWCCVVHYRGRAGLVPRPRNHEVR
jgi:hypothetical protein